MIALDHLILAVKDPQESVDFYTGILGLTFEGVRDPFHVLRVNEDLTLQLAPWGTKGGEHLAFALTPDEFTAAFDRIKAAGIDYGDSFDSVGNMQGPGEEPGARGNGPTVYCFDPNQHLIEIRTYPD